MSLRISLPADLCQLGVVVKVLSDVATMLSSCDAMRSVVSRLSNARRQAGEAPIDPWCLVSNMHSGRAVLQAFALRLTSHATSRAAAALIASGPELSCLSKALKVHAADVEQRLIVAQKSLSLVESEVRSAGLFDDARKHGPLGAEIDIDGGLCLSTDCSISVFVHSATVYLKSLAATYASSSTVMREVCNQLIASSHSFEDPESPGTISYHSNNIFASAGSGSGKPAPSFDCVVSGLHDLVTAVRKAHAAHPSCFLDQGQVYPASLTPSSSSVSFEAQNPAAGGAAVVKSTRKFPVVITGNGFR